MLVLHAAARPDGLWLWGEAAPDATAPAAGSARLPEGRQRYPYDAGPHRLTQALAEVLALPSGREPVFDTALLWAPTRGRSPSPSSPLVAEPASSRGRARLAAWAVSAAPLEPPLAVDLLCACMGRETLGPGLLVGADLAWCAEVARLAGALVSAGHFLPSVAADGAGFRACWVPVVLGEDAGRLARLGARMPAAARALTGLDASRPPAVPPERHLQALLGRLVDSLVRAADPPLGLPRGPSGPSRRAGDFPSLHDQWLHALRAEDDRLVGEPPALARFAEAVGEWQRPLIAGSAAPLRLCLRLEEPPETPAPTPAGDWYVRFLLQPVADPSLLVPVSEAWRSRGQAARWLAGDGFDPREYALTALAQACALCPSLEGGLRAAVPEGVTLALEAAHRFLIEDGPALQQAGFPVLLPAWWAGRRRRLSARASVRSPRLQAGAGLTLDRMLEFDWEVALGGETLTRGELEALARLKAPLVRHRGEWVAVSPEDVQAALALWQNPRSERATLGEVVRMRLGAAEAPGGLSLAGVEARGAVGELLARLEGSGSLSERPPPRELTATLRPYQVRGFSWLCFLRDLGLGACLADDMGLGKTVQTLALLARDREEGKATKPVLLVCPTSVVSNWQREAARFAPGLPVLIHHGAARNKRAAFARAARDHALVVSSYALLARDLEFLAEVEWGGVVLDEAQAIKNPETRQARAARALHAEYRIVLTGTPVENHVGDLWSLMEFLNPGLLGSQAAFKRRFFIPIQTRADPEATERLRRLTSPFILRRLKTDRSILSDLPDKQEMKVFCSLTREQASLYTAVLDEATAGLAHAEGIQRRGLILATLMKLKQVCNHPAHFLGDHSAIAGRSGKLALLEQVLGEVIEAGDRALVFTQFAEMGAILRQHLQEHFGREVLFLHGGVPRSQRDHMVGRFQEEAAGPPVFVLSLKAGGTGLNLTRANHVVHFDRWWNPAVEDQATDRVFRIGQRRDVQVRKLVCAGTFEERIDRMIEDKKALAQQVVGAGEGWLTELSSERLRDLFALDRDAVGD